MSASIARIRRGVESRRDGGGLSSRRERQGNRAGWLESTADRKRETELYYILHGGHQGFEADLKLTMTAIWRCKKTCQVPEGGCEQRSIHDHKGATNTTDLV